MEIKKTATPQKQLTRVFGVIDKTTLERRTGAVLCTTDRLSAFDSQNYCSYLGDINLNAFGHYFGND